MVLSFTNEVFGQFTQLYTVEEGLSSNWVHSVTEDKFGFVWAGTARGLNRFDGKNFKVYSVESENPDFRLKNEEVYFLKGDDNGFMWSFSSTHIEIIDINTDKIAYSISFKELLKGKFGSENMEGEAFCHIDTQNRVYLVYNSYVFELTRVAQSLKCKLIYQSSFYNERINLIDAYDGGIWLYNNLHGERIHKINGVWKKQDEVQSKDNPYTYVPRLMNRIFGVSADNMRLWKGSVTDYSPFQFPEITSSYFFLQKDKKNRIWIYNTYTLHVLNPETNYLHDLSSLSTEKVIQKHLYSLHLSESDVLWCGSFNGLLKIANPFPVFDKLFCVERSENQSNIHSLRGIASDKKGNRYLPSKYNILRFNSQGVQDTICFSKKGRIPMKGIYHIYIDENQDVWVADDGSYFGQIVITGNTYQFKEGKFYSLRGGHFSPIGNGKFWIAGELFGILDTKTNSFSDHPLSDSISRHLPSSELKFVFQASNGDLWVGGREHLYRIPNPEMLSMDGITKYFEHNLLPKHRIVSNDMISEIREDSKHNIWVGTKGQGLYMINTKGEVALHLEKKDGLSNNMIAGILEADNGNMWISTFNGLNEYNPFTGTFHIYYKNDGIAHNEFNIYSAKKDDFGRMYFGGINGLTYFDPKNIENRGQENDQFPLVFTGISCYSEEEKRTLFLTNNKDYFQPVVLNPNDRLLLIQFALLGYPNPEQNQYSYKIEELSAEWKDLGRNSEIRLPYLDGGYYTIRIRGKTANGNWNTQELELQVFVKQVYYKTWWFTMIVSGIFIGVIIALYRYQVSLVRKRQQVRTSIAADLHDEVGSLLTRLSMQAEMASTLR